MFDLDKYKDKRFSKDKFIDKRINGCRFPTSGRAGSNDHPVWNTRNLFKDI